MDTYGIPELVVSPISQVRLLEYPIAYAGCFYLGAEFAQGVCVQFGICEAAVAGKAAAALLLRV